MMSENIIKCIFGLRRFFSAQWIHDVTIVSFEKE